MIFVTTCRHATPPVRRLAKEIAWVLGHARKVNRGRMSLAGVVLMARNMGASRVIVVGRGLHGNPGIITFLNAEGGDEGRRILSLSLRGVVFSGMKSRPPVPESHLPVVSLGASEEIAENLAFAFDTVYLGSYALEDLASFSSYSRVIAVEGVKSRSLALVLKFLEKGEPIGPKLLVKRLNSYM